MRTIINWVISQCWVVCVERQFHCTHLEMTKVIVPIRVKLFFRTKTSIAQKLCWYCPQNLYAMNTHQFSLILFPTVVSKVMHILFIHWKLQGLRKYATYWSQFVLLDSLLFSYLHLLASTGVSNIDKILNLGELAKANIMIITEHQITD